MISSMTGYGRAQELIGGRDITVEIKSVNHRYFEFFSRVPRTCGYLEEKLKGFVQSAVSRGKVELYLAIQTVEGANLEVELNSELADSYIRALRAYGEKSGVPDDLSLSNIARLPEVFSVRKPVEDEEEVWAAVRTVAQAALERFCEMRTLEGMKTKADLLARLEQIAENVERIGELSPETVAGYRARLHAKLTEVLADSRLDEQRILTEAAIFAEKIAVDEETVRLRSHIAQFREILGSGEPVGRKLDFLVQEMNRETNTIGSKAQDINVAQLVVGCKAEIEKIREQIQNIE